MTTEGAAVFNAQWRYMDVKLVEAPPRQGAGPRLQDGLGRTAARRRGELRRFGVAGDRTEGAERPARRRPPVHGVVSNDRSRSLRKVGTFDTTGATAVFHITVDDYAEVWVNGELPRRVGMVSPHVIAGFNLPNRVVISQSVKPGEKVQIAVFGINGPISLAPENPLFVRDARVEFYR